LTVQFSTSESSCSTLVPSHPTLTIFFISPPHPPRQSPFFLPPCPSPFFFPSQVGSSAAVIIPQTSLTGGFLLLESCASCADRDCHVCAGDGLGRPFVRSSSQCHGFPAPCSLRVSPPLFFRGCHPEWGGGKGTDEVPVFTFSFRPYPPSISKRPPPLFEPPVAPPCSCGGVIVCCTLLFFFFYSVHRVASLVLA